MHALLWYRESDYSIIIIAAIENKLETTSIKHAVHVTCIAANKCTDGADIQIMNPVYTYDDETDESM